MKVGIVLYPGAIFFEIALTLELISEKVEIEVYTPNGNPIETNSQLLISKVKSYRDVEISSLNGLLIPGGDAESVFENETLSELLRKASEKEIVIGAICFGPVLLARAGVLKGRKISHGITEEQKCLLKGTLKDIQLIDDPFYHDGPFITAKPWAYIDFAVEFANRLGVLDLKKMPFLKSYYRGYPEGRIRPLALAVIQNSKEQFLFHKGWDSIKKENFYRPLGGGIEFGETAVVALHREILEELQLQSLIEEQVGFFENIFTYEGRKGHEFISLHIAKFQDESAYEKNELDIVESGRVLGKAVWRSLAEISDQGASLYPLGLDEKLRKLV